MRQRVSTLGTAANRPSRTEVAAPFRRRTMSFPGFLPNGEIAMQLSGEAAQQAAELLRNRKNSWVQLAGHKDTFAPAGPKTLWKKQEVKQTEARAYTEMSDDSVKGCIPKFYREACYDGSYYIEIEDLLQKFSDPNVIDIKMGTRTFLESEVSNPALRKDLYEKMVKLDPEAPTAIEREQRAVTKLRYMRLREDMSSSSSLGFRIDALRMSGEPPDCALKRIKQVSEVSSCLRKFLRDNLSVTSKLLSRLQEIRTSFEQSNFFLSHEVVGSSLLLLYDNTGAAGAWMIDFGKTRKVERVLDHRSSWRPGNHEDGFLTGVDNLIQIFTQLSQTEESNPSGTLADLNCCTSADQQSASDSSGTMCAT